MIKNRKDAGCNLQKGLNKHRQEKNCKRDESAHVFIIACWGLYFHKVRDTFGGMKKVFLSFALICGVIINFCFGVNQSFAKEIEDVPELYIRALNPGYVVDGKNNVGEMIELARTDESDTPISLAGITIDYTNSSGTISTLVEFPEHSWMTGETILLRLASSPESELATLNYTKTLAMKAGPLELKQDGKVIDSVCWTAKDGCEKEFKSSEPTTLVREKFGEPMMHVANYEVLFDEKSYYVENEEVIELSQCKGVIFSEILSYYETSQSEQFIELYNANAEQVLLDGCYIKYKNKSYELNGIIQADEYKVRNLYDFSLTKNPTSSNILELVDVNGEVVDKLEYPNGQRKGTSYALIGYDENGAKIWRTTYAVTPGEANNYQEYKTCEAGKVINEETGNCVKVTTVAVKVCGEGQYLNPLTGRCKKIEIESIKTCKEGYELNPETNRCRKIKENTGAEYALVSETYEEKSNFVAVYVVIGIVILGVGCVIYEFRHEILKFFHKVFQ